MGDSYSFLHISLAKSLQDDCTLKRNDNCIVTDGGFTRT